MSEHKATITWSRGRHEFTYDARDALARLHEQAHEHCFIANSVRTEIEVKPEVAS